MTRYTSAYLRRLNEERAPNYHDQLQTAVDWCNDAAYPERQAMTAKEMHKAAADLHLQLTIWEHAYFVAYAVRKVASYPDWYSFLASVTGPGTDEGTTWCEYMLANEDHYAY